ncbi:YlxM family DNA-binding protein [Peptoniphilus catoniae]|uniref:YlxM family DNA-binding protein n=1 Tax=Peptoniphilus catoniae TaxID=1660341 RepID=UPI0010FF0244|nr:sigma factor-like helix-turn-helix DNA-binding protein [Peptoniphilus catoniae]
MIKLDRKNYGDILISNVFEINMLLDFYRDLLSEKQEKSLSMYYAYDFSLTEIAEELNISKQAVSDNIKRAEQNLRFYEKSLKLVSKHLKKMEDKKKLKELFKKLEENSKEIDNKTLSEIYTIIFNAEEV